MRGSHAIANYIFALICAWILAGCDGSGESISYPVSGRVLGLSDGGEIVLAAAGSPSVVVSENGGFSLGEVFGSNYSVRIEKYPLWQDCSIRNGTGVFEGPVTNVLVTCAEAPAFVSTLAGSPQATGPIDGDGAQAAFWYPFGIAVDRSGTIYVADGVNNLIRKIRSTTVTTLAGGGPYSDGLRVDGVGADARFDYPMDLEFDSQGNIIVVDMDNNSIRKVTPTGVVTTIAGTGAIGADNGRGASATFKWPQGIAIDAGDNIYIADTSNHLIRKIDISGFVTTFAGGLGGGDVDGIGENALFKTPLGMVADKFGNIYVADCENHKIRRISQSREVVTFAGSGSPGADDGVGVHASFNCPGGIAIDARDNFYVVDMENQLIRKISPSGMVTTIAGSGRMGSDDGEGRAASFSYARGIAIDTDGLIYIADGNNQIIRKIYPVRR